MAIDQLGDLFLRNETHKRFGKLPWKDVVMPASELAGKGFKLSKSLAGQLNSEIKGRMKPFAASVAAYGLGFLFICIFLLQAASE